MSFIPKNSRIFLMSLVLLIALCGCGHDKKLDTSVRGMYHVSTGIYRGARPDSKQLEQMKEFGIRTVISLEEDKEQVQSQRTKTH